MINKQNRAKFISIIIFCISFIFPINAIAQSFIDDASQYTVRFRVLVDHPFVEDTDKDEIIRSWVGAGFVVDKSRGLIVTNAHVSGAGNTYIKIAFKGERFILINMHSLCSRSILILVCHTIYFLINESL